MLSIMLSQSLIGGLAASRKDMGVMPHGAKKPHVTKQQILAWREDRLSLN